MVLAERASFSSLPPTSNTLTRAERAHRRRSANKVGRVLGIAPQVMDLGSATMTDRYWSMTTAMISSHVSLPALPYSSPAEVEDEQYPYNGSIFIRGGEPKHAMKSTGTHCPPLLRHPPLLRVARSTHSSPLSKFKTHYTDPYAPAGLGEADNDSLSELFTSSSSEEDDISDSPSPTLSTLSRIAMRRRKMERVQRILGEDVPVSMVFPENRTDRSGLARDDMDVSAQTPSRKLRSKRSRRPQSAPARSAHFFPASAVEANAPGPRTDRCSESEKSATSPAQEMSPPVPVLQKTRRKRPVTPRPDHPTQSFFQNSKSSESEMLATSPEEWVLVSPPAPVLQKPQGGKRPATPHPHYRSKSFFRNSKPSESEKPATSPAQEPVLVLPPVPVLQKTQGGNRPATPHPHYRSKSYFQNSKPSESATSPAQESVRVSPPVPVPQKTPGEKSPTTPHPHYRTKSFFQNNNQTQPATAAKYSYIYYPDPSSNSDLPSGDGKTAQIMEFGEAQCLRTIIESPDELASVLARDSSGLGSDEGQEDRSSSGTGSSDTSLPSDWDSTSTAIHAEDRSGAAAVKPDEKQDPVAESGTAEPPKHVWRHKRKPPPVYEP